MSPSNRSYTPYTEKFGDLCGGAYLSFGISGLGEGICEDPYIQKVLSIADNGSYDVSGYDRVEVDVHPDIQSKSVVISENGDTVILPDEGCYLSSVEVTTNILPVLQDKVVEVVDNGSTTVVTADDGYYGLGSVSVDVAVPYLLHRSALCIS